MTFFSSPMRQRRHKSVTPGMEENCSPYRRSPQRKAAHETMQFGAPRSKSQLISPDRTRFDSHTSSPDSGIGDCIFDGLSKDIAKLHNKFQDAAEQNAKRRASEFRGRNPRLQGLKEYMFQRNGVKAFACLPNVTQDELCDRFQNSDMLMLFKPVCASPRILSRSFKNVFDTRKPEALPKTPEKSTSDVKKTDDVHKDPSSFTPVYQPRKSVEQTSSPSKPDVNGISCLNLETEFNSHPYFKKVYEPRKPATQSPASTHSDTNKIEKDSHNVTAGNGNILLNSTCPSKESGAPMPVSPAERLREYIAKHGRFPIKNNRQAPKEGWVEQKLAKLRNT